MFFNLITNWWRSIDKGIISAIFFLMTISAIMVATASPAVAERIGLDQYYFIKRQLVFLTGSVLVIFIISTLNIAIIKKMSFLGFLLCILMLIAVLLFGNEIKGARRWINLGNFALQPSEFLKPFFIIMNGWVLSMRIYRPNFHSYKISFVLYVAVVCLLILQPDFGMTIAFSVIWAGQIFLAGISLYFVGFVIFATICGSVSAYAFLPHVKKRIQSFMNPSSEGNYQVSKSLEALSSGGFYGKGPGEGVVKQYLPDSHTDFIFAVIAEEMGIILCLLVIICFMYIIIGGFLKIIKTEDSFTYYVSSGVLIQFATQVIINIGVNLNLLPTKGMTLPLISYGGSSMLGVSIALGVLLSLTRKRFGVPNFRKVKI